MYRLRVMLVVASLLMGNTSYAQTNSPPLPDQGSSRSRLGNQVRAGDTGAPQSVDFRAALVNVAGANAPVATRPWFAPSVNRRLADEGSDSSSQLEFKVYRGDRVVAPTNGKVVRIGDIAGSTGLLVDHGSGFFSMLTGSVEALVSEGANVSGDQLIAQVTPSLRGRTELSWSIVYAPNFDFRSAQGSIAELFGRIEMAGVAIDTVAVLGLTLVTIELDPAPSGRQFEIQLNDQVLDTLSATRPPIRLLSEPRLTRVVAREGLVFKSVVARDTARLEAGERVVFKLGLQPAYQAQPQQTFIRDQMVLSNEKSTEVMDTTVRLMREASSPKLGAPSIAKPAVVPAEVSSTVSTVGAEAPIANPTELPSQTPPRVATPAPIVGVAAPPPTVLPLTQPSATTVTPLVLAAPAALPPASDSRPAASPPSNRKALVIGNDRYASVAPLLNARADAEAIGRSLDSLGYKVTVRLDLDERQMKTALRDFRMNLEGGDEVVFFFAGHGVQLGAVNYLLPVDIRGESEEQVRDDAMPLQRILDDLADRRIKLTLAIIDACRDNPFPRSGRTIGGRGRGLAPTPAATGQMVVYSAGAGQQALDRLGPGDKDPNGLFTRMLLREMRTPGMRVDSVIREVRKRVVEAAQAIGHEQVPAVYDQVVGDFYFVR
jgi:hypothetical protein